MAKFEKALYTVQIRSTLIPCEHTYIAIVLSYSAVTAEMKTPLKNFTPTIFARYSTLVIAVMDAMFWRHVCIVTCRVAKLFKSIYKQTVVFFPSQVLYSLENSSKTTFRDYVQQEKLANPSSWVTFVVVQQVPIQRWRHRGVQRHILISGSLSST